MPRPTRRRPKSVEAEGDEALAQAVRDALGHWLRRELPPSVPNGLRELMPASLGGEFGLAGGCDDDELVFPATLTAKQRRTIHLVATELSVPHGSRDVPSGEGRACVLSRSGEFRGGEPTRSFKRATAEMDDDAPPGGFHDGAAGRELRRWCADHEDDATLGLGVEKPEPLQPTCVLAVNTAVNTRCFRLLIQSPLPHVVVSHLANPYTQLFLCGVVAWVSVDAGGSLEIPL